MIRAEDHIGLVVKLATKYKWKSDKTPIYDSEEYADGLVGLMQAIKLFDESRGIEFSTYAYISIRNEIWKGQKARKEWKDLKQFGEFYEPPSSDKEREFYFPMRDKLKDKSGDTARQKRIKYILRENYEKERTLEEIAEDLGVSRQRVSQLKIDGEEMIREGVL